MSNIDRYADLAIFVKVAEAGGFSAAAKPLGISTSHASRAVARLENRLGARLMNRTTRRVALTEAGRALLERASALLGEIDELEGAVSDQGGEPRGSLRVTLPVHFGLRYVAPLAAEFARQHPAVNLQLSFEDRRVDLLGEGYDLAVRVGALSDSSLIARRLGRSRGLTVAAPSYLKERGVPEHPRDLLGHEALLYAYEPSGPGWRFSGPDGELTVRVTGRFLANNGDALATAAIAGLGVARLPDALAAEAVQRGLLTRVLIPWESDLPISAVYPPGRHLSPKVRAFVDYLAAGLAPAPWLACSERG